MRHYAEVLGGEIVAMQPHEGTPAAEYVSPDWRAKILHARLHVGDAVLMASDSPPGMQETMQGISVALIVEDPDEAERIFNAFAEGDTVTMPLTETFWAKKFGMLTDRFGTPWMINCEKPMSA
jgi:PhnB protein